jgi:CheY-like chemotaxis protein
MTDLSSRVAPSVALMEADPDTRNLYTQFLESRGARVHAVASATDVLACLQDGSLPDALIFDVVNLGMKVPEFCKAVRRAGNSRSPRLILVTGWLMSPHDDDSKASEWSENHPAGHLVDAP